MYYCMRCPLWRNVMWQPANFVAVAVPQIFEAMLYGLIHPLLHHKLIESWISSHGKVVVDGTTT